MKIPNRSGFTLVQVLVVLSIIALLAALWFGTFGRGREAARRVQCDKNLKIIVVALDAYRQERGHFPASLSALIQDKYLQDPDVLHCASDPRSLDDSSNHGYGDYYVLREPRADGTRPIVVCPFHERQGNHGVQGLKGASTKQFSTVPAVLVGANDAVVESPGRPADVARAGMPLHGGDIVRTGGGGAATIQFWDKSVSELRENTEVTVLQSYITGQTSNSLYTLLRQARGRTVYTVTHGSKFDVVTPTATAGALGTQFEIDVAASGVAKMKVNEGKVQVSELSRSWIAPNRTWVDMNRSDPVITDPTPDITPAPEPTPEASPTPNATPTPGSTPTPTPTKKKHGGDDDDDDDDSQ